MKYLLLLIPFFIYFFFFYKSLSFSDILKKPSLVHYQYAASSQTCELTYKAFSKTQSFSSTKDALLYFQQISPRHEIFVSTDKDAIVLTSGNLPFYFFESKESCEKNINYIQNKYNF